MASVVHVVIPDCFSDFQKIWLMQAKSPKKVPPRNVRRVYQIRIEASLPFPLAQKTHRKKDTNINSPKKRGTYSGDDRNGPFFASLPTNDRRRSSRIWSPIVLPTSVTLKNSQHLGRFKTCPKEIVWVCVKVTYYPRCPKNRTGKLTETWMVAWIYCRLVGQLVNFSHMEHMGMCCGRTKLEGIDLPLVSHDFKKNYTNIDPRYQKPIFVLSM